MVRHAHNSLGFMYEKGGDLKKAKFHYKVAAMAGHELARSNIGVTEGKSGNREQAIKHISIAASAGCFDAMHGLTTYVKNGLVSKDEIDSILTACITSKQRINLNYLPTHMLT